MSRLQAPKHRPYCVVEWITQRVSGGSRRQQAPPRNKEGSHSPSVGPSSWAFMECSPTPFCCVCVPLMKITKHSKIMLSGPPTGHFLARRGLVKKQYRRLGRTAGGSRQYTHATSPDGLDSPIRPPTDAFQTVGIFFRHAQTPRINSPSTASALLSLFESDQFPSHILCRQTHVGQIFFSRRAHKKISAGAKKHTGVLNNGRAESTSA